MLYCIDKKGMWKMNGLIKDLYRLPNVGRFEDIDLQMLSEHCAVLEDQLQVIARNLPDKERGIVEAYIYARNDLEVETFKTALRWGKQHYK